MFGTEQSRKSFLRTELWSQLHQRLTNKGHNKNGRIEQTKLHTWTRMIAIAILSTVVLGLYVLFPPIGRFLARKIVRSAFNNGLQAMLHRWDLHQPMSEEGVSEVKAFIRATFVGMRERITLGPEAAEYLLGPNLMWERHEDTPSPGELLCACPDAGRQATTNAHVLVRSLCIGSKEGMDLVRTIQQELDVIAESENRLAQTRIADVGLIRRSFPDTHRLTFKDGRVWFNLTSSYFAGAVPFSFDESFATLGTRGKRDREERAYVEVVRAMRRFMFAFASSLRAKQLPFLDSFVQEEIFRTPELRELISSYIARIPFKIGDYAGQVKQLVLDESEEDDFRSAGPRLMFLNGSPVVSSLLFEEPLGVDEVANVRWLYSSLGVDLDSVSKFSDEEKDTWMESGFIVPDSAFREGLITRSDIVLLTGEGSEAFLRGELKAQIPAWGYNDDDV